MKKILIIATVLIISLMGFAGCGAKSSEPSTEAVSSQSSVEEFTYFKLADGEEGYEWEMLMSGEGAVDLGADVEEDQAVGQWQCYTVSGVEPGEVAISLDYRNGADIMYTVTFNLTVNEDGTVTENSRDGDIDQTMTE